MNRPTYEARLGRVKAVVWPNQTSQGAVRHNVTFARLYKDGDQWKESHSFGRDDLPLLAKVADQAFEWIYQNGSAEGQSPDAEPPASDVDTYQYTTEQPPV